MARVCHRARLSARHRSRGPGHVRHGAAGYFRRLHALVLNRYETILASVSLAKDYVISRGKQGDPVVFLRVVIPTALGAVAGLVLLSNFLKWMLRRHEQLTLGVLLGLLFGSVVGIWPFDAMSQPGDYALGLLLALAGFSFTALLAGSSARADARNRERGRSR